MLKYKSYRHDQNDEWAVFVHGAGGSSAIWFKQLRAFRERLNVLLVDLRGHGRSRDYHGSGEAYTLRAISRDVVDVLDRLEIESAHFVGVSLGSIIIRCVDDMVPERVRSMVMSGAITGFNAWARFLITVGHTLKYVIPFRYLYALFAWIIMPGRHAAEAREVFKREARKVTPDEFKRWLSMTRQVISDLREFAAEPTNSPVCYVMGGHDYIFLDRARNVARRFDNAQLSVIEESGHVCNVECPDEFNDLALQFIQNASTSMSEPRYLDREMV